MAMSTKPVTLHYRGSVINSTPEQIAGRWCAPVEVLRPDGRTTGDAVPFSDVYEERDDACVEGLEAGKRWIDARFFPPRSS
jgi:hypothetical protein